MRPENLAQYIGQQHLLAPGKPLPRAIEAGHLHSMISGAAGYRQDHSGGSDCPLRQRRCRTDLSGNLRVKEIREAIERARQNRNAGRRTILFVDEVHALIKASRMPFCRILKTAPLLIGATTENPSFELNSALLSRARVYLLKSLTTDDIERVLDQR